ncbi:MAG: SCP2 sterol-binding domain-containing protein [Pseudomonadota bacterium]|nr:SCP2 sterol-binding domain-containing protein [Pseudomonadota bacterium]MEC8618725.1 SCP2 sterol-binding domain-containing protein [Pseudomonadota bacterium]MEC8620647.1 SCP2 sterol-binding domain-containing protein [Pseudomonadota bacterium]
MHHDSATLLLALQRLLNDLSERAIHLDPVAAKNFTSLTGQVIEIHCLEPALTWHLTLQESSIEVHAGASNNPNVAVTGKPLGLLQMLMTGATSETVVIDGDAAVLMALHTLAKDYSPDPAKLLDAWLGRETGQRAAALVELGMANLGELLTSTRANAHHATQNYFSERYATQDQGKGLAGRLDQLRLRIDRLEAKLNRYQHPETPD